MKTTCSVESRAQRGMAGWALALSALMLLGACGQKGPLRQPPPAQQATAA
ncbi:lipoprotein [Inhella sp.]